MSILILDVMRSAIRLCLGSRCPVPKIQMYSEASYIDTDGVGDGTLRPTSLPVYLVFK